jgi:hypothetical protein
VQLALVSVNDVQRREPLGDMAGAAGDHTRRAALCGDDNDQRAASRSAAAGQPSGAAGSAVKQVSQDAVPVALRMRRGLAGTYGLAQQVWR